MYDGFLKMVLIIFICNWTRGVMGSNPSEGSYMHIVRIIFMHGQNSHTSYIAS